MAGRIDELHQWKRQSGAVRVVRTILRSLILLFQRIGAQAVDVQVSIKHCSVFVSSSIIGSTENNPF